MIQKLVFSALVVMMSTAAFAQEGREARDVRDQAKDDVAVQHRNDAQNQAVGADYIQLIAQDQSKSASAGGATAQKVLSDDKLSTLPGVKQMAVDIGNFRNVKIKDPATGQERFMTADEARVAALGKVRTGLTDEEFIKACGE